MTKRTKEFLALKPMHQLLVAEYMTDFNATRAYTAAGFPGKNADVQGPRMIQQADVQAAVQAETKVMLADLKLTPGKVLRDLEAARIAAMANGKFSAAVMAIERMVRYRNIFPHQYRANNGDVPIPGLDGDPDNQAPVAIDDVSRRILFLLTGPMAPAGEKPAARDDERPVTIQ